MGLLGLTLLGVAACDCRRADALQNESEAADPRRLVVEGANFSVTAPGDDWTWSTLQLGLVSVHTCAHADRSILVQVLALHVLDHINMEKYVEGMSQRIVAAGGSVQNLVYEPSSVPQAGSQRLTFDLRSPSFPGAAHCFGYVTLTSAVVLFQTCNREPDEPEELRQLLGSFTLLRAPENHAAEEATSQARARSVQAEGSGSPADRSGAGSEVPPANSTGRSGAAPQRLDRSQAGRVLLYFLALALAVVVAGTVNAFQNRPVLDGFRIAMLVIVALLGFQIYRCLSSDSFRPKAKAAAGVAAREREAIDSRRSDLLAEALGMRAGEALVPFGIAAFGSFMLRRRRAAAMMPIASRP